MALNTESLNSVLETLRGLSDIGELSTFEEVKKVLSQISEDIPDDVEDETIPERRTQKEESFSSVQEDDTGLLSDAIVRAETPYEIPRPSTLAEDTSTWDRDDQLPGYDGYTWEGPRLLWYTTSTTGVLYFYPREERADITGKVYYVGPEVREIVFETEECQPAVSVANVTGDTTLDEDNEFVNADTTSADIELTFPAGPTGSFARTQAHLRIVNTGTGGNTVTLTPDGSETIGGSASETLYDGEVLDLYFDGTGDWA